MCQGLNPLCFIMFGRTFIVSTSQDLSLSYFKLWDSSGCKLVIDDGLAVANDWPHELECTEARQANGSAFGLLTATGEINEQNQVFVDLEPAEYVGYSAGEK